MQGFSEHVNIGILVGLHLVLTSSDAVSRLTWPGYLNKHLEAYMKDLSANVFRTYNTQNQLDGECHRLAAGKTQPVQLLESHGRRSVQPSECGTENA